MNKNANSADVIRLPQNKAKAQEQQRPLLKSLQGPLPIIPFVHLQIIIFLEKIQEGRSAIVLSMFSLLGRKKEYSHFPQNALQFWPKVRFCVACLFLETRYPNVLMAVGPGKLLSGGITLFCKKTNINPFLACTLYDKIIFDRPFFFKNIFKSGISNS